MAGEEFRASLHGGDAADGGVQARDLARLISGLEAALAAARRPAPQVRSDR